MRRIWKNLRFVAAYASLNLSSAMEYRAAFISQTAGMMLNDAMMIVFWWMFFQRFPHLSGWASASSAMRCGSPQ
jgi:ABC-2 type transport system permease protein